jgi:predicted SAM-dependent methyltransferase
MGFELQENTVNRRRDQNASGVKAEGSFNGDAPRRSESTAGAECDADHEWGNRRRGRLSRRFATKILPLHAWRVLRSEPWFAWLRLTRRKIDPRFADARHLLVNIGCGPFGQDGWVNIDCSPAPGVTCVRDCRTSLPLPAGSAKGIFTEHFLEHLDYYEQVPLFLEECWRVLEPGGTIRVIVPDGGKYLDAYEQPGWDALRSFSPLVGWDPGSNDPPPFSQLREVLPFRTKMEVVNFQFRLGSLHLFCYDYETLAGLLTRCGFESVRRQEFGSSALKELAIDREERAAESLVVEGTKPPGSVR